MNWLYLLGTVVKTKGKQPPYNSMYHHLYADGTYRDLDGKILGIAPKEVLDRHGLSVGKSVSSVGSKTEPSEPNNSGGSEPTSIQDVDPDSENVVDNTRKFRLPRPPDGFRAKFVWNENLSADVEHFTLDGVEYSYRSERFLFNHLGCHIAKCMNHQLDVYSYFNKYTFTSNRFCEGDLFEHLIQMCLCGIVFEENIKQKPEQGVKSELTRLKSDVKKTDDWNQLSWDFVPDSVTELNLEISKRKLLAGNDPKRLAFLANWESDSNAAMRSYDYKFLGMRKLKKTS